MAESSAQAHGERDGLGARDAGGGQQQQSASDSVSSDPSREQRIREAAYAAAERRGFAPGHEVEDWLDAEREVGQQVTQQAG
ncbi:hypothetical protein ASF44_15615 [Pseudorhodoferax sp. Leaf274]|nr:hypothetical protein ASF44_15615 [Pseudorhodoferax sp. Leaf274]